MKLKFTLIALVALFGMGSISHARYYETTSGRFISPDPFVEDIRNPQSLNRYAYVRNNPINYVDPLGLWRIGISFHAGFGGHFFYDSDTGQARGGVGVGVGYGASVGDDNWDVGYSNDNYLDLGYDNKTKSAYIEGHYGSGGRGPNGEATGYSASGTYYFDQEEYVVGGGVGYYGVGVNGSYSSFGNGTYATGGSVGQVGATYDHGSNKWNYSYTVDPKALQDSYNEAVKDRKYNGYGPRGSEKQFFIIDWVGTVMAGFKASDRHDEGYIEVKMKRATIDLRLMTDMVRGSLSNFNQRNGLLRTTIGLAISPMYYTAVTVGGGPAYKDNQRALGK